MPRRVDVRGSDRVYKAARRFSDAALRGDDSLFTPGRPIWTLARIEDLYKRFVNDRDTSSGIFLDNLKIALHGAHPDTIQLAAELLYFRFLITRVLRAETKRKQINEVLSISISPPKIPDELDDVFECGLIRPGPVFNTRPDPEFRFLLEYLRRWKGLTREETAHMLDDPWAFRNMVETVEIPGSKPQQLALMHLVHPDSFEAIVSVDDKEKIAEAFADLVVTPTTDIDRQLSQIRAGLIGQQGYGPEFHFYLPEIRRRWDPSRSGLSDGTRPETEAYSEPIDYARPETVAYAKLLTALKHKGLYFAEEVISNYLLALQSKRFVIITGISGTGKTKLAMAVAKHFQPKVKVQKVTHTPDDAMQLSVFPHMLKYHQMIIPAQLAANLRITLPEASAGGRRIDVVYPGRKTDLAIGPYGGRDSLYLVFSSGFRTWFDSSFKVGDTFILRVGDPGQGGPSYLEFSVPSSHQVEETLDNYHVVAVRPDWTDSRGLLGYYNPIIKSYSVTPFLHLLLRAQTECESAQREGRPPYPFFVILDEMNLARVEHYFSDFLSCLESGEPIHLHDDVSVENGENEGMTAVPRRLTIPRNVFFTGTVNIDETTYMFSPKVLDRAFTLDLNQVDLQSYGSISAFGTDTSNPHSTLYLHKLPHSLLPYQDPSAKDWEAFGRIEGDRLRALVTELHGLLAVEQRHFGYRVANEIARFIVLSAKQAGSNAESLNVALDLAILAKILPKFNGTQQELEPVLTALFAFAIAGRRVDPVTNSGWETKDWRMEGGTIVRADPEAADVYGNPKLPRTAAKLWRMLRRLRQQGFTSFME